MANTELPVTRLAARHLHPATRGSRHHGDGSRWVDLRLAGTAVSELLVYGNGKDCDLTIALADGTRLECGVDFVRVHAAADITVEDWAVGDLSRAVRYVAPDLAIEWARVAFPVADEEETREFRHGVRAWAGGADPSHEHLRWVVDVELALERRTGT